MRWPLCTKADGHYLSKGNSHNLVEVETGFWGIEAERLT
jgi:hypothetical protein